MEEHKVDPEEITEIVDDLEKCIGYWREREFDDKKNILGQLVHIKRKAEHIQRLVVSPKKRFQLAVRLMYPEELDNYPDIEPKI